MRCQLPKLRVPQAQPNQAQLQIIYTLHHIMHCLCIPLIVLYNLSAMRVYSGLFEADRMAQLEDRVLHQETIIKALQAG